MATTNTQLRRLKEWIREIKLNLITVQTQMAEECRAWCGCCLHVLALKWNESRRGDRWFITLFKCRSKVITGCVFSFQTHVTISAASAGKHVNSMPTINQAVCVKSRRSVLPVWLSLITWVRVNRWGMIWRVLPLFLHLIVKIASKSGVWDRQQNIRHILRALCY